MSDGKTGVLEKEDQASVNEKFENIAKAETDRDFQDIKANYNQGDTEPKDSTPAASTPQGSAQGGSGQKAAGKVAEKGKEAVKKGVNKAKKVGKAVAKVAATNPYVRAALIAAQTAANLAKFLRRPEDVREAIKNITKKAKGIGGKILMVVLIIAFIIIFAVAMVSDTNQAAQSTQTTGASAPALQITKSGPTAVAKGGNITYTINVSYAGSATNITVNDTLPQGTTYVSSCFGAPCIKGGTYNNGAVTWDAQKMGMTLNNPISLTFTLTVKAPNNDTYIINQSDVQVIGGSAGGGGSGGIPTTPGNVTANSDNCHGVYSHWMSMVQRVLPRLKIPGANYGDPQCTLVSIKAQGTIASINPGLLLTALQTIGHLSPNEAKAVWTCVIPNESGYDPNAFNPKSTSNLSSGTPGAFGLFQMNALGFNWAPYDVGDVDWTLQIANGVKMRNHEGGWHGYWPSSYQGCLIKFGVN